MILFRKVTSQTSIKVEVEKSFHDFLIHCVECGVERLLNEQERKMKEVNIINVEGKMDLIHYTCLV